MKRFVSAVVLPLMALAASAQGKISTENVSVHPADGFLNISADIVLDGLDLKANNQIFITPVLRGGDSEEITLPSLLINGRNMHISYERGALKGFPDMNSHNIMREVMRRNGKPQTEPYITRIPLEKWMRVGDARFAIVYDTCGCGVEYGKKIDSEIIFSLNPAKQMRTVMMTPAVTELPIEIHEGKARVQFEVDKTELHAEPYVCRNGQRIDNREQLQVIDDSVKYALSNPNVEIAGIAICGYASPESPYMHNEYLATNRSRALAEYLADRYNLPREVVTYSSVPENWKEFREMVAASDDLTEQQRNDLLELIDRPAYGASDYDAKEKELKTSPKFAKLYRSKILPEWFPKLRATTFAISTRLKPMSDQQLAEVLDRNPELMTLNQMFRVARLYPEGSPQFNAVIRKALARFPDDPTANLNAAAAAVSEGKYDEAKSLLNKAGDTPEAWNLRGIIATAEGEFEQAKDLFGKAESLPEAETNANLLSE